MKPLLVLPLLVLAPLASAQMTTIDFEGVPNNTLLSNQYVGLGATFGGADSIVSTRSTTNGYQAYPARSGTNVLMTLSTGLTNVSFLRPVTDVTVWVLSPQTFGAKLIARDAYGAPLATVSVPTSTAYQQLVYHGAAAAFVTLQAPAGFATFDDLSFNVQPTPEPAAVVGFLSALAFLRRRRA